MILFHSVELHKSKQVLVLQELLDIFNDIIPKIQQCLNAINKLWGEKEVPPRGDGHGPSEEGDAPLDATNYKKHLICPDNG